MFERYEAVEEEVRLVLLSAYDWQHNTLVHAPEPVRAPWPCVEALAQLERYCARRMKRLKTGVYVGTDFDLDTVRDLERYGFWPFDVEIA